MILKIKYSRVHRSDKWYDELDWVKDYTNKKIKDKWRGVWRYHGYIQIYYRPCHRSFTGTSEYSFFFDTEYKGKKDHTYELLEKLAYSVYRDVKIDKIIDELINDL